MMLNKQEYRSLKQNVSISIFKSKVANVMIYSHRHKIQAFIDFGSKMGMLCMNLYSNPVG